MLKQIEPIRRLEEANPLGAVDAVGVARRRRSRMRTALSEGEDLADPLLAVVLAQLVVPGKPVKSRLKTAVPSDRLSLASTD